MIDARELGIISDGARLQGFLPYLEDAVKQMEAGLEGRIFQLLDKGELTPDLALYAWMEKLAYRRLLRKFDQKVRSGQHLGQKFEKALEAGGI